MSIGSILSNLASDVVGKLGPQTGPAAGSAVTTVANGDFQALGHNVDTIVDGAGFDTAHSTILHGVAQTVADLSSTGLSTVLEPVASTLLAPVTSTLSGALATPVGLLAPHTSPAAGDVLTSIGSGSLSAIGQAAHGAVDASGADLAQSTILHGTAGAITSIFSADNLHFNPSSAGGSDGLSGVLNGVTGLGTHAASVPTAASQPAAAHADAPVDIPHPLADLAHAVHHA